MDDRITPYGLFVYVVGLWLEAGVLLRPALVAKVAGPDLWLSWALGLPPLAALALLIVWIGNRFPGETFVEHTRRIWGRWLGSALVAAVVVYWLAKTAEAALLLARIVSAVLLPRTPFLVLVGVALLVAAYITWQGVGPAVRLAEFVVVPSLIVLVGTMLLSLPDAHFGHLKPILRHGWRPVLQATATLVGHAQGMDALLLLFPWLSRKSIAWKTVLVIAVARAAAYVVMLVTPVLVLGVPDTIREVFPVVAVARSLELRGLGVERIDSLFVGVWLLAAYLPVAFRLYLTASGLARLFGTSNYRPFIWPVLAVCALAVVAPNDVVEFERYHQMLGLYGLGVIAGVIPLLAVGVWVRGRRRGALRQKA